MVFLPPSLIRFKYPKLLLRVVLHYGVLYSFACAQYNIVFVM